MRKQKVEAVDRLAEMLSRSTVLIATDYRGLSVSELSRLRRQLRGLGIEYHVVKNTLAGLAAQRAGKPDLRELLRGPTAIAFGYGDVIEPARALANYLRSSGITLGIKGGLLGKQALSAQDVSLLSRLPSREVLISKLLGGMQSPIFALQSVLSANLRGLVGVLRSRVQQLEGG